MTRLAPALLLVVLFAPGCALFTREATRVLADADARAANGDYPAALAAYDAYLTRFPDDEGAPRARAVRAVTAELIAARAELAVLRERVPARDAEVARLRHELNARQAEVTRLREDLEALKRTDLQMERRRR
jgi:hypothetical protein